ncbi:MAG: YraN family protein [Leptospirales bacterium]
MSEHSKAENAASVYLRKSGFQILSRNRRIGSVEIDILAKIKRFNVDHIYFVEVKQVQEKNYRNGYPPFSVKQRARYNHSVLFMFSINGRSFPCHISLIVFNEHIQCIDFFPDYA